MTSTTLQIFIAVNQDGDYQVSTDIQDSAVGDLQHAYTCDAIRAFALNVTVDLPVIETIPVTVPAQERAPTHVTVADRHGEI